MDVLTVALSAAVPLHMAELDAASADELVALARECADVVASQGDNILFRGARRGDTAKAFNALARGLAVCAFAPGGVDFAGLHWEAGDSVLSAEVASRIVARDGAEDGRT